MKTQYLPAPRAIDRFEGAPACDDEAWMKFNYSQALNLFAQLKDKSLPADIRRFCAEMLPSTCKDARGGPDDQRVGDFAQLPRWFGPRAMRVLPQYGFMSYRPQWCDHDGIIKTTINGESVKIYMSEPYPWFYEDPSVPSAGEVWSHVTGDMANRIPAHALEDSQYLASVTGCDLVCDRVAWHSPDCFRLTFYPYDFKTPIKLWREKFPEVRKLVER